MRMWNSVPRTPNEIVGLVAQVVEQDRQQILIQDASAGQLLPIPIFGQVGVAAEGGRPLLHGFVERQVLEGVQRIMVHEDPNRRLRGQQVCRVLDVVLERPEPFGDIPLCRVWSHKSRGIVHS